MPAFFYKRLRDYYLQVGSVLRGEAEAAAIFPNGSNRGSSREETYADFLRQHAPSKCNVLSGGFLFGLDGSESGQLDIIITNDTAPQFRMGKLAFAPVDGCIGVASIKSTLDKKELEDCLRGFAKIPHLDPGATKPNPQLKGIDLSDWPLKIIYASEGIAPDKLAQHLDTFYLENPDIPLGRRPNAIHVAGKYFFMRLAHNHRVWDRNLSEHLTFPPGTFRYFVTDADLQAIVWVIEDLQCRASAASHVLFSYSKIIHKVSDLPLTDS